MDNERIESRPPLGRENSCDRSTVCGVGTQAIDRFRRKGDETSLAEQPGGIGDGSGIAVADGRFGGGVHHRTL
jgi:hypothetical protein